MNHQIRTAPGGERCPCYDAPNPAAFRAFINTMERRRPAQPIRDREAALDFADRLARQFLAEHGAEFGLPTV